VNVVLVVGVLLGTLDVVDEVAHVALATEQLGDRPSSWLVWGVKCECCFHVYITFDCLLYCVGWMMIASAIVPSGPCSKMRSRIRLLQDSMTLRAVATRTACCMSPCGTSSPAILQAF